MIRYIFDAFMRMHVAAWDRVHVARASQRPLPFWSTAYVLWWMRRAEEMRRDGDGES